VEIKLTVKEFSLLLILALSISGCIFPIHPDDLPTALPVELTITPLPTETLRPSSTPTSTATSTPTVNPNNGVFKPEQQEQLRQASLKYLADTDGDAVRMARSLSFVEGADVSNMCGPLAIAILKDAGFLPGYVDLKDFWLLDPRQGQQRAILDRDFPVPQYANYRFYQPLNTFDFHEFPLKAGDFLYLYAGSSGSFEHMLVVTRVDEAGRAYSVTNFVTEHVYFSLFAIQEVMLYDPAQPGLGKFYEWTDKKNIVLGLTGFDGFELWRRIVSLTEESE
jgi:hypothetical protein